MTHQGLNLWGILFIVIAWGAIISSTLVCFILVLKPRNKDNK